VLVDEHPVVRLSAAQALPRAQGYCDARVERPCARVVGLVFVQRDRAAF
jgi:hypothetical protein